MSSVGLKALYRQALRQILQQEDFGKFTDEEKDRLKELVRLFYSFFCLFSSLNKRHNCLSFGIGEDSWEKLLFDWTIDA